MEINPTRFQARKFLPPVTNKFLFECQQCARWLQIVSDDPKKEIYYYVLFSVSTGTVN
jgi:hypothetical protein